MRINKDSLTARANSISKERGIPQNVVYNRFFYDSFLSRLAKSCYSDHFVLKGGLYLSSILGIDNRSTMDIDFLVRRVSMERDKIVNTIKEIASMQAEDGITFEVVNVGDIRKEDKYGGFQITVLGRLETCDANLESTSRRAPHHPIGKKL